MGIFSKAVENIRTQMQAARGPTPEQEIQNIQLEQLKRAVAEQEQVSPFALEELGLRRTPEGGLERIEQQDELQRLLEQRALQALRGELPVSPALEADIAAQRTAVEEHLARRLGPGALLSTPGLETTARFGRQAALTREEARRGALGQAVGLAGQRRALLGGLGQQRLGGLQGFAAPRLGLLGAGGAALQPYQFERQLQMQREQQEAANRARQQSDIFGLIGLGLGGYLGGPTGATTGSTIGSTLGGGIGADIVGSMIPLV